MHGCAVEDRRCGIGHHPVVGESGVRRSRKAVYDALRPLAGRGLGHLENNSAAAVAGAGIAGGAIEISGGVGYKAANRTRSILSSLEAVENALRPSAAAVRELVDRAQVVGSSVVGRPVEIASLVEHDAAVRQSAIGLISE